MNRENKKNLKKYLFYAALVVVALSIAIFFLSRNGKEDSSQDETLLEVDSPLLKYGIDVDLYEIEEDEVKKGDYFSKILERMGVGVQRANELAEISQKTFDVRNFRVGQPLLAYYTKGEDRSLAHLLYEKDKSTMVVYSLEDSLSVRIESKEIVRTPRYVEVTIESSLWEDTKKAGVTPLLAIKLSDIYAWSIDFFGLQKGDSFRAYFNEVSCEGAVTDIDEVFYAVFSTSEKEFVATYFEEEGSSNRYWNDQGESMRKSFLKSPLKYFSRISSGFTYARRHPITRKVRPHTGIDYAAPKGTPVMSIGEGVVVEKGYKGGGGHTVKIKHNSVYTSAYLHLSKYGAGIKVGSRVSQGQIIGYVGSTGSSTGPHLDFRIWKNGSPINPLKMESPPAEPIAKENMEQFLAQLDQYKYIAENFEFEQEYRKVVLAPLGQ